MNSSVYAKPVSPRIVLRPALATLAIFSFLFNWNDFIHPLIYLRSTDNYTLSLGLRFFQQAAEKIHASADAYPICK